MRLMTHARDGFIHNIFLQLDGFCSPRTTEFLTKKILAKIEFFAEAFEKNSIVIPEARITNTEIVIAATSSRIVRPRQFVFMVTLNLFLQLGKLSIKGYPKLSRRSV